MPTKIHSHNAARETGQETASNHKFQSPEHGNRCALCGGYLEDPNHGGGGVVFFALSGYGWGKSATAEKARKLCQSNSPTGKRPKILTYRCHPSTQLDGLNGESFVWDKGAPKPELVA